jgi:serine/threonine protein kinase
MGIVKTGAVVGSIQVHLLQELMDSLQERVYEAGASIAANPGDLKGFFIVSDGTCDVLSIEGAVVGTLNEFDCFGSESLVTLSFPVDKVVAKTKSTILFLSQMDLDNVLIANETSVEQQVVTEEATIIVDARLERSSVAFNGFLSSSNSTFFSIGSIGTERSVSDVSIHSFAVSRMGEIDLKKNPIARCKETSLLLACGKDAEFSVPFFVPVYKGLVKEANAVHFIYSTVLSCEIAGLYGRLPNRRFDSNSCLYVASCVYSALKYLHTRSIVFRNVQSEGIHIDNKGRVVLVDHSISKVLGLGGADAMCERTYTLCGAKEYIAPEQLDTEGYGVSVDFWALGILLYEMASGGFNPFVASKPSEVINEFAVWSRVKAFGTPDFPVISFPDTITPGTLQDLISNFIVPSPKNRLGTRRAVKVRADSSGSIDGVAFSSMFGDYSPARLANVESPLLAAAQAQSANITAAGADAASSVFELWAKPLDPNPAWFRDL